MKRGAVAVATLAAVLAVPGVASAHKYKVWAGDPGKQPSGVPAGTALDQFLPAKVTVRKGDSVTYSNVSFHTVSIVGKGTNPASLALAAPDPAGGKYEGINTPSGGPFYFNGLPKFIYNPAVFAPSGSRNVKDTKSQSCGAIWTPGPKD